MSLCEFEIDGSDNQWSHTCRRCGWSRVLPVIHYDLSRECPVPDNLQPCSCPIAGYCERHKMRKTPTLHNVCKSNDRQRAVWDYIAETGNSPNGERPSPLRAAYNFSLAAIKHAADGGRLATDEAIHRRLETCHTCPSMRFNGKICEHLNCGCSIQEKKFLSKLAWASEACPDGHWSAET